MLFYLGYLFIFILGACVGSFVNAWVWRVHEGLAIWRGRSLCPHCRRQLCWYENIPVVSYLALGGRCRTCHAHIPWWYFLVEVCTGILWILAAYVYMSEPWELPMDVIRDWFIISVLVFIFLYDWLYQEILDGPTLIVAGILFVISLLFGRPTWSAMLIGVAVGAGFFAFQYIVSRGRWIGGGDIRLGLLMGVILGWPLVVSAIFLAYVIGVLVYIPQLVLKKTKMTAVVPFGTYLTVATVTTMFWGERILNWYLGLL